MYHDKNGWTPISEGLSKDGDDCFVWHSDIEDYDSWCYAYFLNGEIDVCGVTHWRPTFKPPVRRETNVSTN